MFTGLVEATGILLERSGARLRFSCPFASELLPGESISVSGVCLTVEESGAGGFWATAIPTTQRRTTLGALEPGRPVNLERPLPAAGRLGGHIVQGHADGTGTLAARQTDVEWEVLAIAAPAALLRYIVARGSVAVDGVSLTVAERDPGGFRVAIVPHTAAATTLGSLAPGTAVNLEVDVLAKYVEALLPGRRGRGAAGAPFAVRGDGDGRDRG